MAAVGSVIAMSGLEAYAASNDWSTPCFQGSCQYDLPHSHNSSASVKLWGSQTAISDLTEPAGWKILGGCNSTSANGTKLRVTCMSANSSDAGCDHLMQNGAKDTIVRMPENCTDAPFMRVSDLDVDDDQSVPAHIQRRIFGRDSAAQPTVHALTLDTNFSAINPQTHGPVSFAIQGVNIPGHNGNFTITPPSKTRRAASRAFRTSGRVAYGAYPALFARDDADPAPASNGTDAGGNPNGNSTDSGNPDSGNNNGTVTTGTGNGTTSGNSTLPGQVQSTSLPLFEIDAHKNLFNKSIDCNGAGKSFSAAISADVDAKAQLQIGLGIQLDGTISPLKIDDFALTALFSGDIDSSVSLTANVDGSINTGVVTLLNQGINGLSVPTLIDIKPKFVITGQATGDIGVGVEASAGLKWNIDGGQLTFPPAKTAATGTGKGKRAGKTGTKSGSGSGDAPAEGSAGTFKPADNPVSVSIGSGASGNANMQAHFIPTVEVGVEMLAGTGSATISVTMDASADMTINATASAGASSGKQTEKRAASVGTCADIKTGLNVNAGANGSFFGLFDANTKVPLFSQQLSLINKCFKAGQTETGGSNETSTETPGGEPTASPTDTDGNADPTETGTDTATPTDTDGAAPTDTDGGASPTDTDGGASPTDTDAGASPTDTDSDANPTSTDGATPTSTDGAAPTGDPDATPSDTDSATTTDTDSATSTDTGSATPTDTDTDANPTGGATDTDSTTSTDSSSPSSAAPTSTAAALTQRRRVNHKRRLDLFSREAAATTGGLTCPKVAAPPAAPLISTTISAADQQAA